MSLKGKPHDISIYFRDTEGITSFLEPKSLCCKRPIRLRIYGDLHTGGEWDLFLAIGDSEEEDAPVYTIHFDEILNEINRRIETVEHSRMNRPE